MKTMKMLLMSFIACLAVGCPVPITMQTFPITDSDRAIELLDAHFRAAIKEEKKMEEANYLFLSDFHRGYGIHDRFASNSQIYKKLLQIFCDKKFTLVLIGDVEEGWGFQKNNVPLIRDYYNSPAPHDKKEDYGIEEKFMDSDRFIGLYGNHDDYLRGTILSTNQGKVVKTHSAALIEVKNLDGLTTERVFITHGCQGHGLHDAGDELAAWGVYSKYNYLLSKKEPYHLASEEDLWNFYQYYHIYDAIDKKDLPRKRNQKTSLDRATAIKKHYSQQETNVLSWVKGHNENPLHEKEKITHLLIGHTHEAVCNSYKVKYEKKFLNATLQQTYLADTQKEISSTRLVPKPLVYYNTGMACNKEIPFLVMAKGKFYYFYMNKDNASAPFTLIKIDDQGQESTTPMDEATLKSTLGIR